jgi:hypothetical protein
MQNSTLQIMDYAHNSSVLKTIKLILRNLVELINLYALTTFKLMFKQVHQILIISWHQENTEILRPVYGNGRTKDHY